MTLLHPKRGVKPLFLRFAAPILAAYLLHWGVLALLFIAEDVVMAALTKTVNWVASSMFASFWSIEEETLSVRLLPAPLADGIPPLVLGLLIGWWVLRRRRKTQQHPLQPS